jgi:hypothetical protein
MQQGKKGEWIFVNDPNILKTNEKCALNPKLHSFVYKDLISFESFSEILS